MNNDLLIVGAGVYGLLAKEIAESMKTFGKIAFVDDAAYPSADRNDIVGTTADIPRLLSQYPCVVVAIGNGRVRQALLERLAQEGTGQIVNLISPFAYISPSAKLGKGCIVEPMAVVHTECEISDGCFVSAGAVINHRAILESCVHVDCNATVPGYKRVAALTKVFVGEVFEDKN